MNLVVVGASGNIGTALLRAAAVRGWRVTGVSRRRPDAREPYAKADWIECDIGRIEARATLAEVFDGADAVVHLAWAIHPPAAEPPMARTNLTGSANVLHAAAAVVVPHLVCASSTAAYSPGPRLVRVDEGAPRGGIPGSAYSVQKARLEWMLDRFEAEHPATRLARLRPCSVVQADAAAELGSWLLPPGTPRGLIGTGAFPAVLWPRLRVQLVHASDVAQAIAAVLERGAAGPFNLAAEPVLFAQDLADAFGGFLVPVPLRALEAAAWATWRLGVQPLHPSWMRLAHEGRIMETIRARRLLGWAPRVDAFEAAAELTAAMGERREGPSAALRPPTARRRIGRPVRQSQRP